jgi:hypothetical protein
LHPHLLYSQRKRLLLTSNRKLVDSIPVLDAMQSILSLCQYFGLHAITTVTKPIGRIDFYMVVTCKWNNWECSCVTTYFIFKPGTGCDSSTSVPSRKPALYYVTL